MPTCQMTSRSERRHYARVAEIPCVLCEMLGRETMGVHVHHLRAGTGKGQKAHWTMTAALCPDCHTGTHGVHGTRQLLRQAKVDEIDLVSATLEKLL